jgi:hypothetical protein
MPARPSTSKRIAKPEAQEIVLDLLRSGARIDAAMAATGRGKDVYRDWMADPVFNAEVRTLRAYRAERAERAPVPDFPEFAARYLHQPLAEHHLRIVDCIEGRQPRNLHTTMRYHKGRPNYVLANMPPEHGKTTQFTINYAVWRITKDPTVRIVLISKSMPMAVKYLHAITQRLTGPRWQEMQIKFAPEGSYRDPDGSWTRQAIYVAGADAGEKDPTAQALGWTGHIYGTRADLVIADDMTDLASAAQWPQMMDYLSQDVDSRIGKSGQLLVVGTRVGAEDLYKHLRDDLVEYDGTPVFTYLAQPAVLEYAERPADWQVLWPEVWPGEDLARKRAFQRDERKWALVFQQADVDEDSTFPPQALQASVNRLRPGGTMSEGWPSGRKGGMEGLYVIGGLDPATVGHTAALVIGVERTSRRRYVLDGFDKANCSPREMMQKVEELTTRLGVKTWVIEQNAFQRFLTQLDEFRNWMHARGVRLRPHITTSQNKFDDQFGVAAMAGLFLSAGTPRNDGSGEWTATPDTSLISLPSPRMSRATSLLLEQLAVWHPTDMRQRERQDLVMALWFAEIEARAWLGIDRTTTNYATPQGATRGDLRSRRVINLNELAALRAAEGRSA